MKYLKYKELTKLEEGSCDGQSWVELSEQQESNNYS